MTNFMMTLLIKLKKIVLDKSINFYHY
uniref:Uncharacterized protein n=1 Tax=Moumouvirus sp. 'Monve' TaxID=1128131 RepID=H2ECZ4_9VIRU|nr:hypothetical protein mv_R62 [Moumouvirus Monve]